MDTVAEDENDALSTNGNSEGCPLFMEGLPRDFSTNPTLAALASLLDEESAQMHVSNKTNIRSSGKQKKEEKVVTKRRRDYKKLKATSKCNDSQEASNVTDSIRSDNPSLGSNASVGEASLFIKMWKL